MGLEFRPFVYLDKEYNCPEDADQDGAPDLITDSTFKELYRVAQGFPQKSLTGIEAEWARRDQLESCIRRGVMACSALPTGTETN